MTTILLCRSFQSTMPSPRLTSIIAGCVLALLCLLGQNACAIESAPQAVHVPHSRQWTMHSAYTGRAHEIFVALPDGPAPPEGFTTIYVLDGNSMFLTATEAVRAYSRRRDADAAVRAIVVGIGYPQGVEIASARAFDLTPDVTEPRTHHPSGGAEAFMDFIVHELKPKIAADFPVNPDRQALIGHSLGGRLTLDMLARHTDAFQHYVAMSASFWFGQHDLVRRMDDFVNARRNGRAPSRPLRVLLSAGGFEQQPRPEQWQRDPVHAAQVAEDLRKRGQITHAQNTAQALAQLPGIKAWFQEIADEDHGTVIPAAIGRAVRFILIQAQAADSP